MPTSRAFVSSSLLLLPLLAAPARGQLPAANAEPSLSSGTPDGPYWSERALPSGFDGSVRCLGTLVVVQSSSEVQLWSAITKRWTVVPVSPAAIVSLFNAYATIEDGNVVHAYATRTGEVDTLTLPGVPAVVHGSSSSNWLSIALLGSDAWGFGAFDGKWVHQGLASANPTIEISQVTGVIHDGVDAWGFSAYFGRFVPTPAAGATEIEAEGDVGLAGDATHLRCFSAHANTWSERTLAAPVRLTLQRGYACYEDGQDLVFYSGETGTFSTLTVGAGRLFQPARYVAAVQEGSTVTCYSAGTGSYDTRSFPSGSVQVRTDDEVAVVTDPAGVTAFSLVTGTFSALVPGANVVALNTAIAWAQPQGGGGYAYSPVQNTWTPAPVTSSPIEILRNTIVVVDGTGYHGFSGRTGTWAYQSSGSPRDYSANPSGDVFLGFDGDALHVFDPVLARWANAQMQSSATSYDTWRQAAVVSDGARAYGFGMMNNTWDAIDLQGTLQDLDANSSAGYVLTDTHVYAYGAHGSLSTPSRWPEFSRVQPRVAPLRLVQVAPPGSAVIALASLAGAHLAMGRLGTLFLDPAQVFAVAPLGVVPAGGVLDPSVRLPDVPALRGVTLHVQDLVTAPSGRRWLTSAIAPVIL